MNYTHGGYPESEAWVWNAENKQTLGKTITGLSSPDNKTRKEAYSNYYEMKRHFMVAEWTQFICSLNDYRKEKGFKTTLELLSSCRDLVLNLKPCGGSMSSILKLAGGLKIVAEALAEIAAGQAVSGAQVAPAPADVPAPKKTKKAEETAVPPSPETPKAPAVDYTKLRADCVALVKALAAAGKKELAVAALKAVKAEDKETGTYKLSACTDDKLEALKGELEKATAAKPANEDLL